MKLLVCLIQSRKSVFKLTLEHLRTHILSEWCFYALVGVGIHQHISVKAFRNVQTSVFVNGYLHRVKNKDEAININVKNIHKKNELINILYIIFCIMSSKSKTINTKPLKSVANPIKRLKKIQIKIIITLPPRSLLC